MREGRQTLLQRAYDSVNAMAEIAAVGPSLRAEKEKDGQRKADNRNYQHDDRDGRAAALSQTMPIIASASKTMPADPTLLGRGMGNYTEP